uniref:Uncharacterized protein n=1 Tax=Arion vulgaris TaxID=1028688 RepID=A0A0B7A685_9EUPU
MLILSSFLNEKVFSRKFISIHFPPTDINKCKQTHVQILQHCRTQAWAYISHPFPSKINTKLPITHFICFLQSGVQECCFVMTGCTLRKTLDTSRHLGQDGSIDFREVARARILDTGTVP